MFITGVKPNDHKKPDPPQEQSEELKQAIAKAMAAANATNTKKYNQPIKNNGFQNRPMGNQPPHKYVVVLVKMIDHCNINTSTTYYDTVANLFDSTVVYITL